MKKKSLIITIPVLNEEISLVKQINVLLDYISKNLKEKYSVSVVIANNGSNDLTQDLGKMLSKQHDNVYIISTAEKGVGSALKKSWQEYPGDIQGYMDLDFSTDLNHISETLTILDNNEVDIVNGSRLSKASRVHKRNIVRTLISIVFNKIISFVFNAKFKDGMCGFKFFQKKSLESLLMNNSVQCNGWFFATEFLVIAENKGFTILDLPINWTDSSSSKVRIFQLSLEYLKEIYILKRRLRYFS
tara:strand:+ start:8 stop:742 length:735 start_codon:yes stop_codon:yes gene_type:complete